jgi:hypothetical protein
VQLKELAMEPELAPAPELELEPDILASPTDLLLLELLEHAPTVAMAKMQMAPIARRRMDGRVE